MAKESKINLPLGNDTSTVVDGVKIYMYNTTGTNKKIRIIVTQPRHKPLAFYTKELKAQLRKEKRKQ